MLLGEYFYFLTHADADLQVWYEAMASLASAADPPAAAAPTTALAASASLDQPVTPVRVPSRPPSNNSSSGGPESPKRLNSPTRVVKSPLSRAKSQAFRPFLTAGQMFLDHAKSPLSLDDVFIVCSPADPDPERNNPSEMQGWLLLCPAEHAQHSPTGFKLPADTSCIEMFDLGSVTLKSGAVNGVGFEASQPQPPNERCFQLWIDGSTGEDTADPSALRTLELEAPSAEIAMEWVEALQVILDTYSDDEPEPGAHDDHLQSSEQPHHSSDNKSKSTKSHMESASVSVSRFGEKYNKLGCLGSAKPGGLGATAKMAEAILKTVSFHQYVRLDARSPLSRVPVQLHYQPRQQAFRWGRSSTLRSVKTISPDNLSPPLS